MRKAAIGVYSLVIAATAAFVVFTPPPSIGSAASAPGHSTTKDSQTLHVDKVPEMKLDRGTYSATTAEEVKVIQEKRAKAEEAAAAKKKAEEEAKAEAEAEKKAAEAQATSKKTKHSTTGGSHHIAYTGGGSSSEWMAAAGIAESDWGYVDYIVKKESGWNPNAVNKGSGASGLVQALPCGKVPGNCFNPVDNLKWADGYAKGRYGSWAQAYSFWTNNHWW